MKTILSIFVLALFAITPAFAGKTTPPNMTSPTVNKVKKGVPANMTSTTNAAEKNQARDEDSDKDDANEQLKGDDSENCGYSGLYC